MRAAAVPVAERLCGTAQAFAILDEIVMGGAVFETSSLEALRSFNDMQRRARAALRCCTAA
jgi:hypothetical protein